MLLHSVLFHRTLEQNMFVLNTLKRNSQKNANVKALKRETNKCQNTETTKCQNANVQGAERSDYKVSTWGSPQIRHSDFGPIAAGVVDDVGTRTSNNTTMTATTRSPPNPTKQRKLLFGADT